MYVRVCVYFEPTIQTFGKVSYLSLLLPSQNWSFPTDHCITVPHYKISKCMSKVFIKNFRKMHSPRHNLQFSYLSFSRIQRSDHITLINKRHNIDLFLDLDLLPVMSLSLNSKRTPFLKICSI